MPPRKNTTKENTNDDAAVTSKTTNSGTCDPVIGMKLFDANNNLSPGSYYSIGPLLGKGEFGSVHCIHYHDGHNNKHSHPKNDVGIGTDWVVKLTPVPIKVTKKQNTSIEIAYRLLWNEYLLYTQHFSEHCGTYLPVVPKRVGSSSSGTNNHVTETSRTKRKHQGTTPIMKYDITTPYLDNHNGKFLRRIRGKRATDLFDFCCCCSVL